MEQDFYKDLYSCFIAYNGNLSVQNKITILSSQKEIPTDINDIRMKIGIESNLK